MDRYKNCNIRLNRDLVIRHICFNYGSVTNYCKVVGLSRSRFYTIVSKPHFSENEKCLQKLSRDLGLSIYDMLLQEE